MQNKWINFFSSILLGITLVFVILSLTILNHRYVYKVIKDNKYDVKIMENMQSLGEQVTLEMVRYDLKKYIKERYKEVPLSLQGEHLQRYEKEIYFVKRYDRNHFFRIYAVTLFLVCLTGEFFLKTKKRQDLSVIFLASAVLLLGIFGFLYINNTIENNIVFKLYDTTNHILLAVSGILLEMGIYLHIKRKRA